MGRVLPDKESRRWLTTHPVATVAEAEPLLKLMARRPRRIAAIRVCGTPSAFPTVSKSQA